MRPLSSEHQQALLFSFQVRRSLAGHPDSAGAPRDLAGLLALSRRFELQVFRAHMRAEEELISRFLSEPEQRRLVAEHAEMIRLVEVAKAAPAAEARPALGAFAELLDRHVRWEERELFPAAEARLDDDTLATLGGELETRLVLARSEARAALPARR